jgi:nonribosomal peptide synthetase protein VioO
MTSSLDLGDAFAEAAALHAAAPAIIHNGVALTYAEVSERVAETARALGAGPRVVGVLTRRSPETVIALLGILAAGGAYCPIDPSFPAPRRQEMIEAAGCRLLGEIVPAGDGLPRPEPDDPAYVLFTSGSTGRPKPVLTSRRAIGTTTAALRDLFAITPSDRVLQFASLNWDTCFEEILPTLTGGGALVFDDEAYTGSMPRFLRAIEAHGITVLDLPTAFWHELVRHLSDDGIQLPSCVRLMIIGGEAANPARVADWFRLGHGGVRLLNTYGCTETTLITHAVDITADSVAGGARIPIGRALPHIHERITAEGELLIGGPAIASGYLGRPEETAERFVDLDGERFFRTGDRVGREADGVLRHEGRLDHAVKIRGVRVDPGEVEARITEHPAVAAAAVIGVTLAGRTALIAYVVGTPGEDLSAWLRERVPAHLVPSQITFVGELVATTSGKTDRAATHRRYASTGADTKEIPR